MKIALVVYPGFTALDIMGPYEVLSRVPGADAHFVATQPGALVADTGRLTLQVDKHLADMPRPDVIVVPGGPVPNVQAAFDDLIPWLQAAHPHTRFTTSVCTGSLVLAAAGLLDGVDATCHWTRLQTLKTMGAVPTSERVVHRGRILTGAGVSAGIDMALTLASLLTHVTVAQAIQLGLEYDPQPPFAMGSPEKASDTVRGMVMAAEGPAS